MTTTTTELRAAILARRGNLTREAIPGHPWGDIYVQQISGAQKDAIDATTVGELDEATGKVARDFTNLRAKYIAVCAVNADGARIFADEDVAAIGDMPNAELEPVYAVITRLNLLNKKSQDAALKN